MYNLSLQIQRQWDDRFRRLITSLWSWIQWRSEHSKSPSTKPDLPKSTRLVQVNQTYPSQPDLSLSLKLFIHLMLSLWSSVTSCYILFLVVYVIFFEIFMNLWGNWKSLSQVLEICYMVLKKKEENNYQAQVYRYFSLIYSTYYLLPLIALKVLAVSTNVICVYCLVF